MAKELTFVEKTEQKVSTFTSEQKCVPDANKLRKGDIVYKRDTGMAFKIVSVSRANGIEHYRLFCVQTNSHCFLSKFALESDYAEHSVKVEHFGMRMVKRLSGMWGR